MLSGASLSSFIADSLAGGVLSPCLLPLNNNPALVESTGFATTLVVDSNASTPVAFGIMQKLSNKQAYCMLGRVSEKYARHTVSVVELNADKKEHGSNHSVFKVVDAVPGAVDKSQWRPYEAVFADDEGGYLEMLLAESLTEQTIGTHNMGGEKNITIDLVGRECENADIWRDLNGFVVSDSSVFIEATCNRDSLFEAFSAAAHGCKATVKSIEKSNIGDVIDYDEKITLYHRSSIIQFLLQHPEAHGVVAYNEEEEATGYALALRNRILFCYAGDEATATTLLAALVSYSKTNEDLTFFAIQGTNSTVDTILASCENKSQITRLHTRTQTTQVKWQHVHIANIGISLF